MGEKSARNNLIIATIIIMITAVVFTITYTRTKKKIENFNITLGKNEKISPSQVIQAISNDNQFGTIEENVRYSSLSPKKGIIEIKEKMFATQVQDVYNNAEDYLGKTIKLEGLFKQEQTHDGKTYCYVLRYSPGCCGYDGNASFEIKWDESKAQPFPKEDAWIETIGVLKQYEEDGYDQYLYLDLISLNVLNKRGAEIVSQ